MQGRWSRMSGDNWFPYLPSEREHWRWLAERIDKRPFHCLKAIRNEALSEDIRSEYWFPQKNDYTKPITNIDRAWRSVLKQMDWPCISLSKCTKEARREHMFFHWPKQNEREEIMAELITWPHTHSNKH